ncbi:hypothetical protein G7066_13340 [Leucobacter coleopterorum]|uniref:Uncharacterized protein n=1 Tax=Leucobacter coleopterorum TaxID=2714933 RepID=A0ABX6JZT9_9MICO|nr:hypothetical protein G7066_13340 [Leucobacter coleopterorum]
MPSRYREDSFSYDRDAFGPVATTEDELLDQLQENLERGCTLEPCFVERIERFFSHLDHKNAQRVYDVGIELTQSQKHETAK